MVLKSGFVQKGGGVVQKEREILCKVSFIASYKRMKRNAHPCWDQAERVTHFFSDDTSPCVRARIQLVE